MLLRTLLILSFFGVAPLLVVKFLKTFHIFLVKRHGKILRRYKYGNVYVNEVESRLGEFGFFDHDKNTIYVNANLPHAIKEYTVAHEYCHSTYAGPKFTSVWAEINCIFLRRRQ